MLRRAQATVLPNFFIERRQRCRQAKYQHAYLASDSTKTATSPSESTIDGAQDFNRVIATH